MSFIVLLILIAIEKLSRGRHYLQKDSFYLQKLHSYDQQTTPNATSAFLKLTLLPTLIIAIMLFLLHNIFHGLLLFFIDIAIMLYALGRGDVLQRFGSFRDAWRRNDEDGLKIASIRDLSLSEKEIENPKELLFQAQNKLLWQSYEGFFAVIFWYMLLGPLIPLFYRLTSIIEETSNNHSLKKTASNVRYYLDWLPSRCLIYSFCVVGQFTQCFDVLIKDLFNKKMPAQELIHKAGIAAIDNYDEQEISSLDILWSLLIRSAILWYALYAIIIIFIF